MEMDEDTCADALQGRAHALVFLRDPRAVMAVLRFRRKGGRARVLGALLPGPQSPDVPELQPGTLQFERLRYDEGALAECRWLMHRLWRHVFGGG